MSHTDKARYDPISRGLSPWYGFERKLQELGRPDKLPVVGVSANLKKRGYRDGLSGVRLTHNRGVIGVIPYASESEEHSRGLALVYRGKGTRNPTLIVINCGNRTEPYSGCGFLTTEVNDNEEPVAGKSHSGFCEGHALPHNKFN